MTLIVHKQAGSKLFIYADTRISEHSIALPAEEGTVKTAFIAPHIAVSFAHSPDLATRDINAFHARGISTAYQDVIRYFQDSSAHTNNDYLVAFADTARVVKITGGSMQRSLASTKWIGDEAAYERFRAYECGEMPFNLGAEWSMDTWPLEWVGAQQSQSVGRWLDVSSAVHMAPDIESAGDFLTVATNVGGTFRYLPHSRLFYDTVAPRLPFLGEAELKATGENHAYRYSAIVPLEPAINAAGFYFPQGKIAYVFHAGQGEVVASHCRKFNVGSAAELTSCCKDELGIEFVVIETGHSI